MTHSVCAAAFVTIAFLAGSTAKAQPAPVLSGAEPDPARWDVAGHVGWLGGNKSDVKVDWDDWYASAAVGASAGYYWTRHVKLELGTTWSTEGRVFSEDRTPILTQPYPYFPIREHYFQATTFATGVSYQWFEIRVRLDAGQRFSATLVQARPDALLVLRRTRVPVPVEAIPYDAIVSIERERDGGIGAAKAAAIGIASGVGAFLAILAIAAASWD
jgi:hypothetical protein